MTADALPAVWDAVPDAETDATMDALLAVLEPVEAGA